MARILIIDDEEPNRKTISRMLERDGHTITEAEDGEKGLEAFRQSPSDIVITDIIMPNKEGIETIIDLRKIDPNVWIIAISGGGRTQNIQFLKVAKKFGANAVLKKPFRAEALQEVVGEFLKTA